MEAMRDDYSPPVSERDQTLGRTLPDLLYASCSAHATESAFHRRLDGEWEVLSLDTFRRRTERLASGLLDLGLEPGDRVALFMDSDTAFCLVDYACLLAGFPTVPLYLNQAGEITRYVLEHSAARALVTTNKQLLDAIRPDVPATVEWILVHDRSPGADAHAGSAKVLACATLERTGADALEIDPDRPDRLKAERRPGELATIIYTSGTTGRPKGVMLSHENLSSNALIAFEALTGYRPGPDGEVVLSILPLSHVLARTLCNGAIARGTPIWFSVPDRLMEDLPVARPTVLATVPRILEKIHAGLEAKSSGMTGVRGRLARWGYRVARDGRPSAPRRRAVPVRAADRLVFSKWRQALGGRVRFVPCGGAALDPRLARFYETAGIPVIEGYGLTETSPVITFNRPGRTRPGWVGEALPHVEIRIAPDGEICTRGPHVMMGYYREPDRTREVVDAEGWFHTGDIGEMSDDGYLRITDRKKSLFKLSTGKYVAPQPLENRLGAEPLVEQAVVVGAGFRFTSALVFPEERALRRLSDRLGIAPDVPLEELVAYPEIVTSYDRLVAAANEGVDPWACIKRFRLVPDHVTVDNGLLTPTLKVRRARLQERFAETIASLYDEV